VAAGPLVLAEGGGARVLVRRRWLREEEERGSLKDVLVVAVGGVDEVVLGEVLPHVPVPVAPLGGPGVHAGHALAAERVETGREISEVEARSSRVGGAGQLHLQEVRVVEVAVAVAEVVHHGHLPRRLGLGLGLRPDNGALGAPPPSSSLASLE